MMQDNVLFKTLLLVEDDPITSFATARALESYNYNVITVSSGDDAIKVAISKSIDLILMDIDLGDGIDGTEAARLILKQKRLPIVFLTSHSEKEMVEKVRGITRYGYIIKNSGNFVLQTSIEMAFELFEAHEIVSKKESHYRTLIQTIPDLIWLKDQEGAYISCNERFEQFFGARENEIIGKTDYDFVSKELADFFREHDKKAMSAGKPSVNEETITFKSDGHQELLETIKTPMYDSNNQLIGVLGIARNITEHRKAEDALKNRVSAIFNFQAKDQAIEFEDLFNLDDIQKLQDEFAEAMQVASIITHTDGTPITKPSNFCRLCSEIIRKTEKGRCNCMRSDAIIGKMNMNGPTIKPCLSGGLWDAGASITLNGKHIANWLIGQVRNSELNSEEILSYADEIGADKVEFKSALDEVTIMSKEQFTKIAKMLYSLANELSTKAFQNIQQAKFIVEKQNIENELIESNHYKETLLKELQHRMKNTLEIVSSFLQLEMDKLPDAKTKSYFMESISRIKTIETLYEQLYTSHGSDYINLSRYIQNTSLQLIRSYANRSDTITLDYKADDVFTDMRTAVNIGLIINEVITNAIKYAYTNKGGGLLSIELQALDNRVDLRVADNGNKKNVILNRDGGIGVQIIEHLAKQIKASLECNTTQGVSYHIRFINE